MPIIYDYNYAPLEPYQMDDDHLFNAELQAHRKYTWWLARYNQLHEQRVMRAHRATEELNKYIKTKTNNKKKVRKVSNKKK